jgi:hypothetical protein
MRFCSQAKQICLFASTLAGQRESVGPNAERPSLAGCILVRMVARVQIASSVQKVTMRIEAGSAVPDTSVWALAVR